jgi:3-deoxy-D-manno-octulosonic-acid transferase
MDVIYNVVVIPSLRMVLYFASWVSVKARRRIRDTDTVIAHRSSAQHAVAVPTNQKRIWFHAASMGEFEQLLPIIRRIKVTEADVEIIATCFSPSAIDAVKANRDVDIGLLIPLDSRKEMRRFIEDVSPDAAVFNRYDLWRNAVLELNKRKIPIVLANATMPSAASSPFLRRWIADTYSRCTQISAVTMDDSKNLSDLTSKNVDVLPDTRIDRVLDRISNQDASVLQWKRDAVFTLVCGSTWRRDEQMLFEAIDALSTKTQLDRPLRLIIVPHEPVQSVLMEIESRIPCTKLSRANSQTEGHILVDGVGMLLTLYSIADAAFVGGGFHHGVHSVIEPIGYNIAVACGPNIHRSRDAMELAKTDVLTIVKSVDNLVAWIIAIANNHTKVQEISIATRNYISSHSGSSAVYAARILEIMSVNNRY